MTVVRALAMLFAAVMIGSAPPSGTPTFYPITTPPGCASRGVKINVHGNAAFNVYCPNGRSSLAYFFDAASMQVTELQFPAGATATVAYDIDDDNFVAGTTEFNQNGMKRYPTVWSPSGRARQYPEPTSTDAFGISPSPQGAIIVGQTGVGTVLPQAARIVPTPLLLVGPGLPNLKESALYDVNAGGTAVGELNGFAASAQLPGALALIAGLPQGVSSMASAINAGGSIVGSILLKLQRGDNCPTRGIAFLSQTESRVLPQFGACIAIAEDINDSNEVVGQVIMLNGTKDAVVFWPQQLDISSSFSGEAQQAGWQSITEASGVNASGQIVGTGVNGNNLTQAFVIL